MLSPWVCIDFDHTIVDHDLPLPGAKQAIMQLKEAGYAIMIHSCNNKQWIEKVLRDNDIHFDHIWDGQGKPAVDAYIDDRGVGFDGDWPAAVQQVLNMEKRRDKIKRIADEYAKAKARM
jgi:hypothetical protein